MARRSAAANCRELSTTKLSLDAGTLASPTTLRPSRRGTGSCSFFWSGEPLELPKFWRSNSLRTSASRSWGIIDGLLQAPAAFGDAPGTRNAEEEDEGAAGEVGAAAESSALTVRRCRISRPCDP